MTSQADKRELGKTLFALILLTALLGQIDIRPFSSHFRFSLGVPALAFIMLYFPAAPSMLCAVTAGAVMVLLRCVISAFSPEKMPLSSYLVTHLPVMVFYLTYGCLFSLLRVRERSGRGVPLFFALLFCEVLANFAELSVRNTYLAQPVERGVFFVILFGVMRSSATAAVYRLTIRWQDRHDRAMHQARYRRMLLFFSNIKTDLLFFHKSMDDIESAMKYSYSLYEKLKDGELGGEALSVSRRIHEVKKEYQRIIASMEKVLSGEYIDEPMRLPDIFSQLEANTETLLATRGIPVTVSFRCDLDRMVRHYYTIISILNNLVINAVEAMEGRESGGFIAVTARREGDFCVIEVADNGPGISEDLFDCIFEPGFSTKFDPNTGAMSTGIGLAHVRKIVEDHCGGGIFLTSGERGTVFRIEIPLASLDGGHGS